MAALKTFTKPYIFSSSKCQRCAQPNTEQTALGIRIHKLHWPLVLAT